MILYGQAGTGKSFIINSLRKKYPNQIIVTATTGLASSHLKGKTIHSTLQLPVKEMWTQEVLPNESLDILREKFEGKKMLVIDEMSMLSQKDWGFLDTRLK